MRMARLRGRGALALLVPLVLFAAACGGGGGGASDPATKAFTFISATEPSRGMDPVLAKGDATDLQFMQLVYGQLLYQEPSGELQPGLAESMTANQDFTEWTLKLRPNLRFSDGTPYDAAAVLAHWKRAADPAIGAPSFTSASEIVDSTVVDPTTLRIKLSRVDGTWSQVLATTALGSVPSPTALAAAGPNYGTTPQTVVGAGAFLLTELQKGSRYVYKRNPDFYAAAKTSLDSVEMRIIPDPTSAANTFRTGGADMMDIFVATQDLVSLRSGGFQTGSGIGAGVAGLTMRTDQGPTSDLRVRLALQQAVDADAMIQRAAPGAVKATTIMDPNGPWANDVPYPTYDPQKAQASLDDYLTSTGLQSVSLTLIGPPAYQKVWEAMKQDFDKIRGLNVTLQIEPATSTNTRIAKRDYQGLLIGSLPDTPRTALPKLTAGSPQNVYFIDDPELTTAVRAANSTDDVAAQKAAMKTVSERLAATVPMVVQYRVPLNWFWQKNVQGVDLGLSWGVIRFENVTKGGSTS